MGNFQFMPTTYAKYAIDGDGDGKINIWENVPDAFHSAANFLKNIGWKDGYRWGREVIVPDDFDWMLIGDEDVKKTTTAWRKLGVKKNDGMPLDQSNVVGYLFAPQGKDGPVFLAYQNFDVIMRWNESYNYAIAVGILSDAIISSQVYTTEINEPLLKKNVIEIQKKLHKMGIYKYDDFRGVVNNRTRSAIREYQKAHGLTPDGYPSKKTSLHILDKCGTK
jgi:membrane-bound lytic murein transglycosylase B